MMIGKILTAPFKIVQTVLACGKVPLEVMCGDDCSNVVKDAEREIEEIWE